MLKSGTWTPSALITRPVMESVKALSVKSSQPTCTSDIILIQTRRHEISSCSLRLVWEELLPLYLQYSLLQTVHLDSKMVRFIWAIFGRKKKQTTCTIMRNQSRRGKMIWILNIWLQLIVLEQSLTRGWARLQSWDREIDFSFKVMSSSHLPRIQHSFLNTCLEQGPLFVCSMMDANITAVGYYTDCAHAAVKLNKYGS